jgi:hypothetical protein
MQFETGHLAMNARTIYVCQLMISSAYVCQLMASIGHAKTETAVKSKAYKFRLADIL